MQGIAVMAGSAALLTLLVVLFRAEEARGRRLFLPGVRQRLDRAVLDISVFLSRFFGHIGTGAFRATFHYFVHRLLARVIAVLTRLQSYLSRLQLRNKHIATIVREKETPSHLDEIASHKEETSLSDEEKRRRRSH